MIKKTRRKEYRFFPKAARSGLGMMKRGIERGTEGGGLINEGRDLVVSGSC